MLALSQLLGRDTNLRAATGDQQQAKRFPVRHHEPKVKRIIQLFMTGGASPMDTFDYKPALERLHGKMLGPKEKPEGFTAPAGANHEESVPLQTVWRVGTLGQQCLSRASEAGR